MENEIHIKEINAINIEDGVIVNGFPSSGMTSAIATESLINTSKFELGGIIDSEKLIPKSNFNASAPEWKPAVSPNIPVSIFDQESKSLRFIK